MFIDMLFKAIPRSVRAGIALLATLIFLPMGLRGLGQALTGQSSAGSVILNIFYLVVGMIAGVVFYYFQTNDSGTSYQDLEILHQHHKDEAEVDRLRNAKMSVPTFPGEEKDNK